MPTYTLKNRKTGEVADRVCSISEMTVLTDNESGEWDQIIGAPKIVTHTGSIINKTSSDWKNLLGKIKKGAGPSSTINT
jgi:hypothetical protein